MYELYYRTSKCGTPATGSAQQNSQLYQQQHDLLSQLTAMMVRTRNTGGYGSGSPATPQGGMIPPNMVYSPPNLFQGGHASPQDGRHGGRGGGGQGQFRGGGHGRVCPPQANMNFGNNNVSHKDKRTQPWTFGHYPSAALP